MVSAFVSCLIAYKRANPEEAAPRRRERESSRRGGIGGLATGFVLAIQVLIHRVTTDVEDPSECGF